MAVLYQKSGGPAQLDRVELTTPANKANQKPPVPFMKEPLAKPLLPMDVRRGANGQILVAVLHPSIKPKGHVRVLTSDGATVCQSADVPGAVARVAGAKNGDVYVATHFGPIYWLPAPCAGGGPAVPLSGTHRNRTFRTSLNLLED